MNVDGTEGCWDAQYKRRAVRVRRIRIPPASDQAFVKVVSYYVFVIGQALTCYEEILPRGRTLEEIGSPEYQLGSGRDDGPVPSRL